jgi:hypothetical protein
MKRHDTDILQTLLTLVAASQLANLEEMDHHYCVWYVENERFLPK